MRRLLNIAIFLAVVSQSWASGEKYHITLQLSPTVEWLRFAKSTNAAAYNSLWGEKLSYNFGIEYKRFFDPSLSFSIGAIYMNKGFRNTIYGIDPDNAGVVKKIGAALSSAHTVGIPLSLNVHHRLSRRVEMIYTGGLTGGYLISEQIRNKYQTGEETPEDSFLDVRPGRSNSNLYIDWYVGAHAGIGISAFMMKKVVLVVQPMYRMQLNNARDYLGQFASSDPFTAKLNSFGIDFKIGYFFTKQISDRKIEY